MKTDAHLGLIRAFFDQPKSERVIGCQDHQRVGRVGVLKYQAALERKEGGNVNSETRLPRRNFAKFWKLILGAAASAEGMSSGVKAERLAGELCHQVDCNGSSHLSRLG
jgi:hypothetical protein